MSDFSSHFESKEAEPRIYKLWEESGYFNPDNLPGERSESFTTIMPPPNANGRLHVGHALDMTLKDVLVRYHRLCGRKALFVPGADHAGFETQVVYEKKLEKEGRSRFQMEREVLYKEMLAFTLENKKYMEGDIRRLGTSCDWSREKFTLDEDVVKKVRASFVKLYQDGLVYRANRIVNWCIKHQTSLSDVETESREQEDALYYITYGPITIATVRPETIFGDVAIAVHPDDERYQSLIGKTVIQKTPIGEREIPVIADAYVEKDFGTGALKITPAHDANDFMIGQKHKLEAISVIDKIGKLTAVTGKYEGMKIADARKAVIADLEEMGLLVKTEPYKHAVKCCYKCQNIIEPRIMEQWFVKMQPLAERALGAVKAKEITFLPERFETMFSYWMENTIDWNISRQIVWGIKIPAWYKDGEIFVGEEVPQGEGWREETDVFDTWFSSGQWPYLVLGYPDSKDFKAFYPADILETGADLVFKWVPRMVFFSKYFTGQIPFKTVYFHGMVNDAQGKKMSKSKGNVMSPIDLIDEFGADALRMALIVGNPAGSDSALSKDKIRGYRNFTTKIWNMAKFILKYSDAIVADVKATPRDNEVFSELAKIKAEISGYLNEYKLHLAAETIYHYIWHTVADKIIEEFKPRLGGVDLDDRRAAATTLLAVFAESMKMLHPFMPFVTEEIWSKLPIANKKLLMVERW